MSYQPKVFRKDGGDTQEVDYGGKLVFGVAETAYIDAYPNASGNLVITESTVGNGAQVHFGVDDDGLDVKFFGATSGKYCLWDESADQLYLVGSLKHHNHLTTESYGHQLRTEYNAATGDFFGIDAEAHQAVDRTAGGVRGLSMCARLTAAKTLTNAANMCAIYGLLDIDGTLNGSGLHAAVVAKVDAGGTFSAVSHLASLWVDSTQEGTVTGSHELIYATNNGASTMDQFIYLYGGNKISNLFELNTCGGMVAAKVDADVTFAHYHKVAVTIDGAAGWLVVGTDS